MHTCRIHRIARCPEVPSASLIGMVILNVESGAFQVEVGIDARQRIVPDFHLVVRVLQTKLSDYRGIVRRIILGEVFYVCSKFAAQHLGNLECDVQIVIK